MRITNKRAVVSMALIGGLVAAGCGSSSHTSATTTAAPAGTTATTAGGATTAPTTAASGGGGTSGGSGISATSFTKDFSAMRQLTSVAAAGKGKIAAILPDTVTSARYTEFDAPYLTKALTTAGVRSSDFIVENAQGSDSTELSDAQSAISQGASVLIMDPLDSGVGASIESYAKQHGVAVINYDRLTLGGSREYYVSFDNVKVGTLIGNGLVSCVTAWGVKNPSVVVMRGDPTDNNATLFAQGYDAVLKPFFSSGRWHQAATPAGTWTPATAQTEFQQAFTANRGVNAVLVPNDENAAPIIKYLQTLRIPPKTFPVTGQDATLVGLQNIISGFQCGTAYKPIYLEAQAAVALALYVRAGKTPPSSLVNGSVTDTKSNKPVPSVLLTPEWVTATNITSTVIADAFVSAAQLCTGAYAADCKTYGIS